MIIWGGYIANGSFNDGARFDPVRGLWTSLTLTGAAPGRYDHSAVWTGSEMIVWGGYNQTSVDLPNIPFLYSPGATVYLYQRP